MQKRNGRILDLTENLRTRHGGDLSNILVSPAVVFLSVSFQTGVQEPAACSELAS